MTKLMSLQNEISAVLIFKLSILIALKYAFFSDPTQRAIQNSPERVSSYLLHQTPDSLIKE